MDKDARRAKARRKVLLHRALAGIFVALTIPGVLWWSESVLFVILLSLVTQVSTEWGASEAADDQRLDQRFDGLEVRVQRVDDRLDRVEHRLDELLERRHRHPRDRRQETP